MLSPGHPVPGSARTWWTRCNNTRQKVSFHCTGSATQVLKTKTNPQASAACTQRRSTHTHTHTYTHVHTRTHEPRPRTQSRTRDQCETGARSVCLNPLTRLFQAAPPGINGSSLTRGRVHLHVLPLPDASAPVAMRLSRTAAATAAFSS